MKYYWFNILISVIFLGSCVTPNDIELGGNSDWVVFGYLGEDEAPVIIVYSVAIPNGNPIYHYDAAIKLTDKNTGEVYLFEKVINDSTFPLGTNEYPFTKDVFNNFVYYSSTTFKAKQNGKYSIEFDLITESGFTEVNMPEPRSFSNVELQISGGGVTRAFMSIDDKEGDDYYRWEIKVNQTLDLMITETDTLTGEDSTYNLIQDVNEVFIPGRFINDERIQQEENTFSFNLTSNLTNYENNDEVYQLKFRLRHYGKEVVDYFTSIQEQNGGSLYDPFIEPVFIESNIDGLIGLIGTYSYSEPIFLDYQP